MKLRVIISARLDELKRRQFEYVAPGSRRADPAQPAAGRQEILLPLLSEGKSLPPREASVSQTHKAVKNARNRNR
jgi:hypothetical protein